MESYIQIVFGTILGFLLTTLIQVIDWIKKRRRANKLLLMEYSEIGKFLDGMVKAGEKHKIISMTEIPNLKMVSQVEELLHLSEKRRTLVYDLTINLQNAENLRQLAVPLLNSDKGNENQLEMYGLLYTQFLKAAKETIDKLRVEMKEK